MSQSEMSQRAEQLAKQAENFAKSLNGNVVSTQYKARVASLEVYCPHCLNTDTLQAKDYLISLDESVPTFFADSAYSVTCSTCKKDYDAHIPRSGFGAVVSEHDLKRFKLLINSSNLWPAEKQEALKLLSND